MANVCLMNRCVTCRTRKIQFSIQVVDGMKRGPRIKYKFYSGIPSRWKRIENVRFLLFLLML